MSTAMKSEVKPSSILDIPRPTNTHKHGKCGLAVGMELRQTIAMGRSSRRLFCLSIKAVVKFASYGLQVTAPDHMCYKDSDDDGALGLGARDVCRDLHGVCEPSLGVLLKA